MVSIGSRQQMLYLIYLNLKGKEEKWILILGLTVLWKTLRKRKLTSSLEEEWGDFTKGSTAEVCVRSHQLSQMKNLEALPTLKGFHWWSRQVSGLTHHLTSPITILTHHHPHPSPSSPITILCPSPSPQRPLVLINTLALKQNSSHWWL